MGFLNKLFGVKKEEEETMAKLNIGIILGSTREGRVSPQVGAWVKEIADKRGDANYTIIDIADYKLPLLGEEGADASGAAGVVRNHCSSRWLRIYCSRIQSLDYRRT